MIYYFPLEYIESRYTEQWDNIIQNELHKQDKEFTVIPNIGSSKIKNKNQFLNSTETVKNRFFQMSQIIELFETNKVTSSDIFFFSDLWFPGIQAIPYMSYFNNINPKIMGYLHAGSFTPTDFVHNMVRWAKPFEISILNMCDKIFVGSNQVKIDLIENNYIEYFGNIYTTGFPIDLESILSNTQNIDWSHKKDQIIFAGRLTDEKQPFLFDRLSKEYPEYTFIKTLDLDLSKREYYALLAESKLMISFALQENYGIAMMEACALGMNILAPKRLSYLDLYPNDCLYLDYIDLKSKIDNKMKFYDSRLLAIAQDNNNNVERIVRELV